MEPVWISPSVLEFFKDNVVTAWNSPNLFHPTFAPLPWCLAVVGRQGVHKADAITSLCTQYNFPFIKIDVVLGYTLDAIVSMDNTLNQVQELNQSEHDSKEIGPRSIIILNHADILLFEPDSETVMLKILSLDRFQKERILVIAILDRTPADPDIAQRPTKPWEKECQHKFFSQFKGLGYASCPNGTFRILYFKWAITMFLGHLQASGRNIVVDLSESDYISLADYSTFSTPHNIRLWLRQVFYEFIKATGEESFNMDILKTFLSHKSGAPHICDYDTRLIEDRFAQYCGKGGIIAPKRPVVEKKKDELNVNVTGFTPDAAGIQEADQLLQSQRKRQRGLEEQVDMVEGDF